MALQTDRPREVQRRRHAGVLAAAERGHAVGSVLRGVVEGERLLQMLARIGELAGVERDHAGVVVRGEESYGVAGN